MEMHSLQDAAATTTPISSFLDLPPELRNLIYELVAFQTTSVKIKPGRFVVRNHALLLVCLQTHQDYFSVLQHHITHQAIHFHAEVEDFNFEDVRTALKRLPPHEDNTQRKLSIKLAFGTPGEVEIASLTRWLQFCENDNAITRTFKREYVPSFDWHRYESREALHVARSLLDPCLENGPERERSEDQYSVFDTLYTAIDSRLQEIRYRDRMAEASKWQGTK